MARRSKRNVRVDPPPERLLREIQTVTEQVINFNRRGKTNTYWHTRLQELNAALANYEQSAEEKEPEPEEQAETNEE